jgi:plastocyanin
MTRRFLLISASAALAFGLGACGPDDTPAGPTAAGDEGGNAGVTVVATDISLSQATFPASAGPVHITYRNDGNIEHTLLVEGVDGFKLDVPGRGDVDQGTVTLAPGTYTIYCDVAGHRQAGMHAKLVVR